MTSLSELEHLISIRIIQEDAETIYSLLASERDSVFSMEIIPYYALFVQSCQEFMGENFLPESTATEIKDIRNHIKIYAESYGKTKKRIMAVDDLQNEDFKSQLRFWFLKNWNIHLNLGTYWTEDRHIIGNTQQLANFLGIKSLNNNNAGKRRYELGYQIGSFVASIREGFSESLGLPEIQRNNQSVTIKHYFDLNTNRRNTLFNDNSSKELNLLFLHLLCNMNFIKYILRELFAEGNTWIFRVEYIVTYYIFRALKRLKNYCENNSDTTIDGAYIDRLLKIGEPMFQSKFRNCMMHYSLEGKGVLSLQYIEQPFYGMIETCFNGMDYYSYLNNLRELSNKITSYLESRFNFSNIELQDL